MSWGVLQIESTEPPHCVLGKQRGGPVSLARNATSYLFELPHCFPPGGSASIRFCCATTRARGHGVELAQWHVMPVREPDEIFRHD
jgi:hypothetical protein